MHKFLIVSKNLKNAEGLAKFINSLGYNDVALADSCGKARRALSQRNFVLLIIDTPLADEYGTDLALHASTHYGCGVVLITSYDMEGEIAAKTEEYGVTVLAKPLNTAFLHKMIKMLLYNKRKIDEVSGANLKLQDKLEELKIVDRAKCILIQNLNMTEQQAHRHIEKQAMDLRISKKEVAKNVLKLYEI